MYCIASVIWNSCGYLGSWKCQENHFKGESYLIVSRQSCQKVWVWLFPGLMKTQLLILKKKEKCSQTQGTELRTTVFCTPSESWDLTTDLSTLICSFTFLLFILFLESCNLAIAWVNLCVCVQSVLVGLSACKNCTTWPIRALRGYG